MSQVSVRHERYKGKGGKFDGDCYAISTVEKFTRDLVFGVNFGSYEVNHVRFKAEASTSTMWLWGGVNSGDTMGVSVKWSGTYQYIQAAYGGKFYDFTDFEIKNDTIYDVTFCASSSTGYIRIYDKWLRLLFEDSKSVGANTDTAPDEYICIGGINNNGTIQQKFKGIIYDCVLWFSSGSSFQDFSRYNFSEGADDEVLYDSNFDNEDDLDIYNLPSDFWSVETTLDDYCVNSFNFTWRTDTYGATVLPRLNLKLLDPGITFQKFDTIKIKKNGSNSWYFYIDKIKTESDGQYSLECYDIMYELKYANNSTFWSRMYEDSRQPHTNFTRSNIWFSNVLATTNSGTVSTMERYDTASDADENWCDVLYVMEELSRGLLQQSGGINTDDIEDEDSLFDYYTGASTGSCDYRYLIVNPMQMQYLGASAGDGGKILYNSTVASNYKLSDFFYNLLRVLRVTYYQAGELRVDIKNYDNLSAEFNDDDKYKSIPSGYEIDRHFQNNTSILKHATYERPDLSLYLDPFDSDDITDMEGYDPEYSTYITETRITNNLPAHFWIYCRNASSTDILYMYESTTTEENFLVQTSILQDSLLRFNKSKETVLTAWRDDESDIIPSALSWKDSVSDREITTTIEYISED